MSSILGSRKVQRQDAGQENAEERHDLNLRERTVRKRHSRSSAAGIRRPTGR